MTQCQDKFTFLYYTKELKKTPLELLNLETAIVSVNRYFSNPYFLLIL